MKSSFIMNKNDDDDDDDDDDDGEMISLFSITQCVFISFSAMKAINLFSLFIIHDKPFNL